MLKKMQITQNLQKIEVSSQSIKNYKTALYLEAAGTLFILTHSPWLLQYSSPVVRMHVPFLGSMWYLDSFLLWGVWWGLSNTDTMVLPTLDGPEEGPEEAEALEESLQIL